MVGIRGLWDSLFAYSRYMGVIKPSLRGESADQVQARLAAASSQLWPKKLSAPVGKRILAFSPHPDDESIGAGGLLLAHKDCSSIHVLTVFNGDGGGLADSAETEERGATNALPLRRDREIRHACETFRAQYHGCLGFSDGASVADVLTASARLAEMVHAIRPDIVIMPSMFDVHPDHRTANLLWARACCAFPCMVLGSEVWSLLQPNAYFEITEQFEDKLALIGEFRSQTATVDYVGLARALGRLRGFHEGCGRHRFGAAEGFFALPNHDYCDLAEVLCA